MTKNNLWWAKFYTNKIEKNEVYVKKVRGWIKRDKADLKKCIKRLTKEEHLEYRYQIGDIGYADYIVIKQKMEDEKNG